MRSCSDFPPALSVDCLPRACLRLVLFPVGKYCPRALNAMALEDFAGMPHVLAGKRVHLAQHAQGVQRYVFHVADRRGDDVLPGHESSCRSIDWPTR